MKFNDALIERVARAVAFDDPQENSLDVFDDKDQQVFRDGAVRILAAIFDWKPIKTAHKCFTVGGSMYLSSLHPNDLEIMWNGCDYPRFQRRKNKTSTNLAVDFRIEDGFACAYLAIARRQSENY